VSLGFIFWFYADIDRKISYPADMKINHTYRRHSATARTAVCICALLLAASTGAMADQQSDTIRQYQFQPASTGYQLVLKQVSRPVIGEGVTRFKVGDRVAGIFFEDWIAGTPSAAALESARGGGPGGMLSEIVVTNENALVSIPEHLSYEEAATLPCAAVTAWVGLFKRGRLEPGQFVLLEGTGGVSTFGLIFTVAAGAKAIMTSSRDEKLERARALGAFGTENYRKNPDWQEEVRSLTGGGGVDQVLDVGGRDTLSKAFEALAYGGHIALIGGLSGYGSDIPTDSLMWINATASGVYVGSRDDFDAMNAFISEHEIRPLIDRVFEFEQAQNAFDYMQSGSFMGKIVIRL
jgi:NADPH:quinone reductase-like Zn-dependent oxidoreductase